MTMKIKQIAAIAMGALIITLTANQASAQYPAVVTTTPAVVGYTAEPAGLFGLRTRYRPVVAPAVTTVPVAPVTYVKPAPVIQYRVPVVRTYYTPAPVVTPVATYSVVY